MRSTTPPAWPLAVAAAVPLAFLAFDGWLWVKDRFEGLAREGDDGISAADFGGDDE